METERLPSLPAAEVTLRAINMQHILDDIENTSKRCRDAAKAVHDALDAAGAGFIWGIMQTIMAEVSDSSSQRSPPRTSVRPATTPTWRNKGSSKPEKEASRDASPVVHPPYAMSDAQATSTLAKPQEIVAVSSTATRTDPKALRQALDAIRLALEKAEHPLVKAANETNSIVDHVEISVLPKIGVLIEEYHDKEAESHQHIIAQLIAMRSDARRFLGQLVLKFVTDKSTSIPGVSLEDGAVLLDIALGRGRDSLIGLFLACAMLPDLGVQLAKVVSRVQARIAVHMAKDGIFAHATNSARQTTQSAQNSSAQPTEGTPVNVSQVQAVDFVILTAIDVELRAVREAFGLTAKDRIRKGTRVYWKGSVALGNDESYTIIVAQATDMANTDAALLTAEMLREWSPNAALLVGIAATTAPSKVRLGDVVVGTEVYYYERGKETRKRALPEPKSIPADPTLLNNMRSMDWVAEVPIVRPDAPDTTPSRHFGVIACGEKVIADAAKRDSLAKTNRKILAIEMEGYGFSLAIWHCFEKVRHLDIRGVCDDASDSKDDRWHEYAAAAAAALAKQFLLDRPLDPRAETAPAPSDSGKLDEETLGQLERAGRAPVLSCRTTGRSLNQPEPGRMRIRLLFINEGPCAIHEVSLSRGTSEFRPLSPSSYHPREEISCNVEDALPPKGQILTAMVRVQYSNGFGNRLQEDWEVTFEHGAPNDRDVSVRRIRRDVLMSESTARVATT